MIPNTSPLGNMGSPAGVVYLNSPNENKSLLKFASALENKYFRLETFKS